MADFRMPTLRNEGGTVRSTLTQTAYEDILPARYLKKDENGEVIEDQEDFFDRVAKNIAVAEAANHELPLSMKMSEARDEVFERDSFSDVISGGNDDMVRLNEHNAKFFGWDAVIEQAPEEIEQDMRAWKEEFKYAMEDLKFVPNTPTLANAGDRLQMLSACFVDSPEDDIDDIHETAKEAAKVFQSGGGMGYAFHKLRPYGDPVGSTGGIASGPITFMRTYDQMCETIAQGGMRRGAQMGVMKVSHPDVIQFIHSKDKDVSLAETLRLNDPDDFTHDSFAGALEEARGLIEDGKVPEHLRNAAEGHLSNFNISVGVTEDFMEAVKNDEKFTFTNPRTEDEHIATEGTQELYELFDLGEYVEVGEVLSVPAREIWRRIAQGAHENGEPGVVFIDRFNEEHSFDVEKHPEYKMNATNPCVVGDTKVATADGRGDVEIQNLVDEEDVPVYTREGDGVGVGLAKNIRKTREDADLIKIETDGDLSLTCTEDHSIWTRNRGWVEAENLYPGDSLHILYETDHNSGYRNVTWTGDYSERSEKISQTARKQFNEGENVVCKECGKELKSLNLHLRVHDMTVDEYREKYGQDVRLSAQEKSNHTVVSVESAGSADVYDLEVPGSHNFYAGDSEDEYMNIHNCGEQPLMEYEACNLGHINLSTVLDKDRVLWNEFVGWNFEASDTKKEDVEHFLDQAIDWDELDERIELGTRFLDNVVTMSDFPVEEIEESVRNNRKIGLGIMGLAQMFVQLGVRYGSDEADEIARQVMQYINRESKDVSHQLAKERGTFENWEDSKWADPQDYEDWFKKNTGLSARDRIGYEMRNHNTTTIAPTGTTSMIGNTSGGCEPIYSVANFKNVTDDVQGDEMLVQFDSLFLETLRVNDIDVENVKQTAKEQMMNNEFDGIESLEMVPDELAELFVTTSELSAREHASIQCALQDGVDSAISKTVNAPFDSTVEDAMETFEYIYENGGKGVTYYRDGTRAKQVLTTRQDNQDVSDDLDPEDVLEFIEENKSNGEFISQLIESADLEKWSENNGLKPEDRPDELDGTTYKVKTGYGKMYVIVNEKGGSPFEVMATVGKSGATMEADTEAIARLISLALRSGVSVDEVIDQLEGIEAGRVGWQDGEHITSVADGIAHALKKSTGRFQASSGDVSESSGKESDQDQSQQSRTDESPVEVGGCPNCGDETVLEEGCETCPSCGWSKC